MKRIQKDKCLTPKMRKQRTTFLQINQKYDLSYFFLIVFIYNFAHFIKEV